MHHRLATLSDFDFIYRIYMDDVGNQYLTYDPMEQEAFKPIYRDLLATNTVYIVEEEGQPVGTYRLIPKQYRQAHTVYLGSLGIDPQHKGKGYGFAILD